MQTFFPAEYLLTEKGKEADKILRSCVHCGFCLATCPTFLLTGSELDSPRGRIYLIKEMLEGGQVSRTTQTHLDRCLSCQSCETTCPSGVQYHTLLSIGREHIEKKIGRSAFTALKHFVIRKLFSNTFLFNCTLRLAQTFKPILPGSFKRLIPAKQDTGEWPVLERKSGRNIVKQRRMIILNGCVQQGLSPNTNAATARVIARLGIQPVLMAGETCCGALSYHLNAQDEGLDLAKHNIDLLCEQLDQGVEAIISTASGCGNFIKSYAKLLISDENHREKAQRVVEHCKDISEILQVEDLTVLQSNNNPKLAFHCPCTLQHGQQLTGVVEAILAQLGFNLSKVSDSHLCCGSAGTYSILQPKLSKQLQANKISALQADDPDAIATANIGCQNHLGSVSKKTVKHWIEYIDEAGGL